MAPKIFVTGVTGYIGGDWLSVAAPKHPEWEITALVRNSAKGAKVAAAYPHVNLVYGDLDSVDLIEAEASKSDVVFHFANCDHEPSAHAIAKGLAANPSPNPVFWIHTSGTLILGDETMTKSLYGDLLPKVFDDWDHVHELTSQPDTAAHRNVDKIVLAAASEKVKTAIVCPPCIYGPGRGPDNQRSMQVYEATRIFLENKTAFYVGKGANIWQQIHVQDLSNLYLLLGEAAVNGGPPATWNDQGYYLAENGDFVWGDLLKQVAAIAHKKGLLPAAEAKSSTMEEANKYIPYYGIMTGTNSRGLSIRGKKLLGWTPTQPRVEDLLDDIVDREARRSGITTGHAATVEA